MGAGRHIGPAGEPGHDRASLLGGGQSLGNRQQQGGEIPRDVFVWPIPRLVADPQIDVMHLDFPKPVGRTRARAVAVVRAKVTTWPTSGRTLRHQLFKSRLAGRQVRDDRRRRPAGSLIDLFGPLSGTTRILRHVLAAQRACQPPTMCIGVAGEVGQDMADRPAGQPARGAGTAIGQLCNVCQESSLSSDTQLGRPVRLLLQVNEHNRSIALAQ